MSTDRATPCNGGSTWTDAADLLAAGPLAKAPGNSAIALIPIGNIPDEQMQAFSAELSRALQVRSCWSARTCAKQASVRPSFADVTRSRNTHNFRITSKAGSSRHSSGWLGVD